MCADGLAHPHNQRQRPIVLDAALATGRDDVVLAHLNHRLVQMSLRLLRAEIWLQGGKEPSERKHLARVALIVHARLVGMGGHE